MAQKFQAVIWIHEYSVPPKELGSQTLIEDEKNVL